MKKMHSRQPEMKEVVRSVPEETRVEAHQPEERADSGLTTELDYVFQVLRNTSCHIFNVSSLPVLYSFIGVVVLPPI